jgi:hypothetical protein
MRSYQPDRPDSTALLPGNNGPGSTVEPELPAAGGFPLAKLPGSVQGFIGTAAPSIDSSRIQVRRVRAGSVS